MSTHLCSIGGKVVSYDACTFKCDNPNPAVFEFIGVGRIYSISGVKSTDKTKYHFWRYRPGMEIYRK